MTTEDPTATTVPTLEELFQGEEPECNCCQSFGIPLTIYPVTPLSPTYQNNQYYNLPQFRALCELCAGTLVGSWDEYHNQHNVDLELGRVICFVGNEIIKTIIANRKDT